MATKDQDKTPTIDVKTLKPIEQALLDKHGQQQLERIRRGLAQAAARWRPDDGSAERFKELATAHFVSDPEMLDGTARHLEYALEMLDGHAHEVKRELSRFQELNEGPIRPVDGLLAAFSPSAHINEDLFKSQIAFVALLNFPLTSFDERVTEGHSWSRKRWALARLAGRFEHRVPAAAVQEIEQVNAKVEGYIDSYNVQMDRLVDDEGKRPFRSGLKLISHWGLRDEIRGLYQQDDGLTRQRMIAKVMERIIRQQIPREVIDSDRLEWNPLSNKVREAGGGAWRDGEREEDLRYQHLLDVFRSRRKLDPYFPDAPTHVDRVFMLEREIPEKRMERLLTGIVSSPVAKQVGALISQRLGRPLEPFDLWYPGFRPKSKLDEPALDAITRRLYPNAAAFQAALPGILRKLGFDPATVTFLAERIVVDPARGAGHASGAKRREDKAHLRTRVGPEGMSYKGYNIAIHELGHNVEQVFSMSRVDHTLLEGVPNTGFTEAFAFLFQQQDLALLGKAAKDPRGEALATLAQFWSAFEIAGVALLDMEIWRWMNQNPQATPAQLREAVDRLARTLWNQHYAPVFGVKDQILPAIYSHIIAYGLYTPDYPLGKVITFQIGQHIRGKNQAREMERMCRLGRLAPDVWMRQAVGSELSTEPLLQAAVAAVKQLGG